MCFYLFVFVNIKQHMTKIINLQSKVKLKDNYKAELLKTIENLEKFNDEMGQMLANLAFIDKWKETANGMCPGEAITVTHEMLSNTGDNNIDQLIKIRDLLYETADYLRKKHDFKLNHTEIYIKSKNARYALGELSYDNLVIFGINPSVSTNIESDFTVSKIKKLAEYESCNGWLILNVYPQITTNHKDIDIDLNIKYHEKNLKIIKTLFKELGSSPMIWAGWGDLITSRSYLKKCLEDIYTITEQFNPLWFNFGKLTNEGHPIHPLSLDLDIESYKFDLKTYISKL